MKAYTIVAIYAPGPEVIRLFSCSALQLAKLRLKFILLINVKMPTIGGMQDKLQALVI